MDCPRCGADAGAAGSCPECGADLGAAPTAGAEATARRGAVSRRLIVAGALVAIAAVAVVVVIGSREEKPSASAGSDGGRTALATVSPQADTGGTYKQLVARANKLFDMGAQKVQAGSAAAARQFAAAAAVYAAAWKKQPGDPRVGTDWSTALFYSGDIEAALTRVDSVIDSHPGFQPAWFNKANYLMQSAQVIADGGNAAVAAKARKQAIAAFRRTIQLDRTSQLAKIAAARIKSVRSQ